MLEHLKQQIYGYFRANIVSYFFVILIFIIGVVIGALAVKSLPEEQKAELISYLKIFFNGLTSGSDGITTSNILSSVLINNIKAVVLIWILGFTIIGMPFVLFIVFTRGFIIGFTVGFLVNEYIIKGILFALVSVLPHNFFAIPAVLITGVSAMSFSLRLVRKKIHSKTNIIYDSVRYTMVCLSMTFFMFIAALLEVYVSPVFMKMIAGILLKE